MAHAAGSPPNTDPQRGTETFSQYVARMAGNELPPDIGATESDADYLTRLASYVPAPSLQNISSSFALVSGTDADDTVGLTGKFIVTSGSLVAYTGSFVNGVLTALA